MAAIRIYRRLQDLQDVDPNGLPQSGVPRYHTDVSSFVVETIAGGAGGSFSLGVSTGGNTLGDTGVTGTRVVLAGGNNITLSQATDANGGTITISGAASSSFSQSVQTQHVHDLTISGNTAGVGALVSSGTLTLAGGSNITLSQNGNAISIIGQSAASETQTFIAGLGNSETTYSSGTVNLLATGNLTIQSTTGQGFRFSVAPQSVQPETQTFIGGVAGSNTTYTSGTVNITGSGIVTVQSGTGQRIIVNASQSVQTQNAVDVTLAGNTAGALALISSGTMTLAGGNNITLSQAGNAVTISGPAAAGAQTAISGIAASNTTYTSGTVTFSGVGGGVTVNSNTGQRVDISVAAQTGTQFSAGLTNSGNTSGDTGTVGGRLLLVGTNNITLSGSTNGASMTITMSGPSVAGAQTGISGIANSQTTYTSGTVSLSELGAITIRSTTGQQFQFSVAAQTAESQSIGMSNLGNTSGTTGIASGAQVRMLFAGGNNVTLSQSLNGASGTITISAANQTVESQSVGMSNIGNTSGTTGIASGGQVRFVFAGGNNITLSQSLNGASGTITISAFNQSVQAETQTFIGGIANTETTYTSGTVKLLELGAITVRSTTGNQFQLSVNAQTGTQFSAGISGGNTSGDTGTVAGRLVLAGGNNITLSGSTNGASETITISAGAGGGFSGGVSNVGNSSGDTGITGSRLVFAGGNSITLSQSTNASGGTITVSAPNASVLSAVSPLSTSTNGSTISILAPAQLSVGFSTQGNTSGDTGFVTGRLALVGSNGITLSGSTNAGSQTITISGITQSVESQSIGMSNIGNTSGTTGIASGGQVRFVLAGGNNITLSQSLNGASGTITISAFTQTVQTQDVLSIGVSTGGNTAGNTTVNTGSRIAFVGTNLISLSQGTAAGASTITIDATNQNLSVGVSTGGNTSGNTTVNTGSRLVMVGSNGITASQGTAAGATTITLSGRDPGSAGMSTMGNTAGDTGYATQRLNLVGGNNVTLSGSTNGGSMTISIAAPSPGAAQYSIGVSNLGNTAGSTGVTGTRIVFVGTNNISLSQSTDATGATISINDTVSAFQAGVSTGGNTTGDTGVTGTRMVFAGSSPITLSQATGANGGTITIQAPATSSLSGVSGIQISTNGSTISVGYKQTVADWENMPRQQGSLISHVSGFSKTPIYWNDHIDCDLTVKSLAFAISMVTASQPLSLSAHLGIYTLVNSTSANLLGSVSEAYVVSSASSVSLSGVRNIVMTGIGTHTALSTISGGEYVLGMMFSATATNVMNFSLVGATGGAGPFGGIYPGTNQLTTGTSQGIQALAGRGSTTVNAMPSNVSQADLVNQGTGASQPLHPWIYIRS